MTNKGCGKIISVGFQPLGDVSTPCGEECITNIPGKFKRYFCEECVKGGKSE